MEVRIKDYYGYIDAEWTIEDGIMVVSPKEVKWKPKNGEIYWYPFLNEKYTSGFCCPEQAEWEDDGDEDLVLYDKGWCFKTKDECQEFCDKLNKAIENIKP